VEIDGLANSTPVDCPDCGDLNGTYVLTSAGQCIWEYELPAAVCGVAKIRLEVLVWSYVPPRWAIDLQLLDTNGNTVLYARSVLDDLPDCLAAEGHALGPLNLPPGATTCDVAAATAHATALRPCGK
jgi:hypothetical protein